MNITRPVFQASVLTLCFLVLGGCNTEGDVVADAEPENQGPAASDAPLPGNGGIRGNSPPVIWGIPETSATVGASYLFQPEASDDDGDVLEFDIANKPGWANFDRLTGTLQGVPADESGGQYPNIVISVTDRNSIASLASFAIQVNEVFTPPDAGGDDPSAGDDTSGDEGASSDDDPSGGDGSAGSGGTAPVSSPPAISGTPNSSVVVDTHYSFQPEASDADGDALSFSIVNKPAWASFDTTSGLLEGRPGSADVGTTDAIEISVTDGHSVSALARFSIAVEQAGVKSFTLSWLPPTLNEDGTALTDLAGYRIYYGTTSGQYSEEVALQSPGMTSYVIENLAAGRYFLVMTSVNSDGLESRYTPEVSFDLGS